MARIPNDQRLTNLHADALRQYNEIQTALRDERLQCLEDRRFYSICGAQWEGPLYDQYENKPRFEVNKIMLSVIRIVNEYRNNRITVDYIAKDGADDNLADTCDGLYRADEQDSVANEAYDNAFEEAVGGGIGAFRLRTVYEDEEDEENDHQRIRFEPIFDADSSVFFDLNSKRQDKSDALFCFVVTSMTRDSYKEIYNDDPTDWPKIIHQYEFDWATPDVVFVAEYFKVEEVSETIRIFAAIDGTEEKYRQDDFKNDETLEETLIATGSVEVRQRKIKRKRVRKYIMSGGKVLEDAGYIAGNCIPIVPVYGKRWFVDNVERCMGHVRLAKDAQRLKNMQLSKLGEISALSSVEKPILTPEQVAGHQIMWADDNLKNYPYLLVNPITGADGSTQVQGPLAYTRSAQIPPAMAALLQITESDMKEILGASAQGEQIVSNISGKAVEMIQTRLDMQTFIYMSNFAKGMKRSGEIWLSMARDIYVEEGRKMKMLGKSDKVSTIELMKPSVSDTGAVVMDNDLSRAKFDVVVDVGPSSSSKRAATVRALTGMLQLTQDPETVQVLTAMAMMNMEGEGLNDVNEFFRKKLLRIGAVKPSEEESQAMMEESQNQQPDPNAVYLQAAAEEASAKAAKARAETTETLANTELRKAQTAQTLSKIGETTTPISDDSLAALERRKKEVEIGILQVELEEKLRSLDNLEPEPIKEEPQNLEAKAAMAIADAVDGLAEGVRGVQSVVENMTISNQENTGRAIEAVRTPKKVIRENGRVVGIE
jgi:hypothetical protein